MKKQNSIKTILCTLIIFSCIVSGLAQDEKIYFQNKINHYKKVKTAGNILGISGIAVMGAGIACIATADWTREVDYYGNTTFQPDRWVQFGVGIGLAVIALPPLTLGTIYTCLGNSKMKKYTEKLNNVTLIPMGNRMYLCYRF